MDTQILYVHFQEVYALESLEQIQELIKQDLISSWSFNKLNVHLVDHFILASQELKTNLGAWNMFMWVSFTFLQRGLPITREDIPVSQCMQCMQ